VGDYLQDQLGWLCFGGRFWPRWLGVSQASACSQRGAALRSVHDVERAPGPDEIELSRLAKLSAGQAAAAAEAEGRVRRRQRAWPQNTSPGQPTGVLDTASAEKFPDCVCWPTAQRLAIPVVVPYWLMQPLPSGLQGFAWPELVIAWAPVLQTSAGSGERVLRHD